jgi:tRNA threonylcarbamoyladenosine biosynthesis protein TsaE
MIDSARQGETALYLSASPEETRALGQALGRQARAGDLIGLVGELGSGKTLFVGGLACGLGVEPDTAVTSPTFTLVHRYLGRLPLYHIDLYRIDRPEELYDLGLEEYLDRDGVTVVEWADRGAAILPMERLTVAFRRTGVSTRAIELAPVGVRYRELMRAVTGDQASGPGCAAGSSVRRGR